MRRNKKSLRSAVVDTNLFVSGLIIESGLPHKLIKLLEEDLFLLIISRKMRVELEEVLHRTKFSAFLSEDKISKFFKMIDTISTVVSPRTINPIEVRDKKDQIVLDTALGGNADYLVTGDRDLLDLKDKPELGNLKIITISEFLKIV